MKKIIIGLVFIVFVLGTAAALTFYQLHSLSSDPSGAPAQTEKAAPTPEEERLAKEREEREAARERELAEQKALDEAIERVRAGIPAETIGGATYYKFNEDLTRGLFFSPILVDGRHARFLIDIVYHYHIHDGTDLAWIHGESFSIDTGGKLITWTIDPKRRHDNIASNAESLTERYQDTIDMDDMRRIAEAGSVAIHYTGEGKTCSRRLTEGELDEVRRLVELYDLLQKKW
ncbi:hypothetical protein TAMA11512_05850 [Selenomonas sp. TAMA-11512]|uniref:hypothetical protein n=1 Tax=Selenomonas sp. TAMA-11512 TaxID=3095337 RepID=UPI00308FDAD3|nr:hypothetical protein TAMA11512_05850 [Selenomonas sp. TAMA-11512]